jgi:uncharacterized lipoprotein YddW (UPF0748 family)
MRPTSLLLVALMLSQFGCSDLCKCWSRHRDEQRAGSSRLLPPPPPREFRAAWVATVSNIDWPTSPNLSTAQQIDEIRAILDKAVDLNLNAIILQVRTSCDAFYPSPYEPWSEYLTGQQGRPPSPYYDPLATWVAEAHRRGIELHAWFNPYRARTPAAKTPDAPNHVSFTHPEAVKKFNGYEWLDPAEPAAREQTLNVIADVVRRYDIDGVHLDDYFYPYPEYLKKADFPDDPAWQRYQSSGGHLSRADWRRDHVNRMIRDIYATVHREKPNVKFGISPFGIAHPGTPDTVKSAFDQYNALYADAQLWLNQGWCDYWTPQLYWKVDSPQPYADLLKWWAEQNTQHRHLWPGNYISSVGTGEKAWPAEEIVNQIQATRDQPEASGNVFFSMKALMQNRGGLNDALTAGPYAEPALVPATPWRPSSPPAAPLIQATVRGQTVDLMWQSQDNEEPALWAVWARHGDQWRFATYPANVHFVRIVPETGRSVTAVNVAAVDRAGNANFAQPLPIRRTRMR